MTDTLLDVDEKYVQRPTQQETNYTPDYRGDAGRCAGCRWFSAHNYSDAGDGGAYCHLIENYPLDVLPTGRCDRWEAIPALEPVAPEPVQVAIVDAASTDEVDRKTLRQQIADGVQRTLALVRKAAATEPQTSGFKVYGNHWFARWSNTFQDRDGQWFSTQAHDDYLMRLKVGAVPMPELWVEHIPGTRIGEAAWVGRIGHFMVAAGTFDNTTLGSAAKAYYQKHGVRGVSHGFAYDPTQLIDDVYHQYNTFEISPLRHKMPSNPFTTFDEVKSMQLTEQDIKLLNKMFGEDIVQTEILAKTEQASKALEVAGVAFKDYVQVDDPTPAASEAVENVEADLKAFVLQLVDDHAAMSEMVETSAKAFTQLREETAAKLNAQDATIAALKAQLDARPRIASQDETTVLDPTNSKEQALSEVLKQQEPQDFGIFGPPKGA